MITEIFKFRGNCSRYAIFALLFVLGGNSYCQDDIKNAVPYKKIEPIEPTVASLAKYGEYNVNYSNGLPDISVPLYEIKSGQLSQNLVLRYHGGGIKASEESTWVGLGFDLICGGAITRQVIGLPDELEDFSKVPDYSSISQQMQSNPYDFTNVYYEGLANGSQSQYSFQQDVYHFNFGDYSGKFVLDNTNQPLLIPHSALKVDFSFDDISITSPEGVKYTFGAYDQTEIFPANHEGFPRHTTTWCLESIISPNLQDTIRYEYQGDGYIDSYNFSYSEGYSKTTEGCTAGTLKSYSQIPLAASSTKSQVHSYKPRYIYFKNGRISFNLSARDDIYTAITGQALQKLDYIKLERNVPDGYETLKCFKFNYSYFNDSPYGAIDSKRLKLSSISEMPDGLDNANKITTSFSYYESFNNTSLCRKTSYSTDYWGYFNGANNATPIPKGVITLGSYQLEIGGADKSPNENYMKLGSLQAISYPTGGRTEFAWEMNRYGSSAPVALSYIPATIALNSKRDPTIICSNPAIPVPDDELYLTGNVSANFTSRVDQDVTIHTNLSREIEDDLTHNKYDKAKISITDLTTGTQIFSKVVFTGSADKVIYLQKNHNYLASVESNCHNIIGHLSFTYNSYDPSAEQYNYPIGGLRIKTIKNYDSGQALIGSRNFAYLDPLTNKSSGAMNSTRTMTFFNSTRTISGVVQTSSLDPGYMSCTPSVSTTNLYHANPITGIYSNSVIYKNVTEYFNDNIQGNGFTEYEFRTSPDEAINEALPLITMEWGRGQLLRQTSFKYEGGSPQKVSETINAYTVYPTIFGSSKGFKMVRYGTVSNVCSQCDGEYTVSMVYTPLNYSYDSRWLYLSSSTTTTFSANGNVTTATSYDYYNPGHCKPNKITSALSNGKSKVEIAKYPGDYLDPLLDSMKSKYMVAYPIEQQVKYGTAGSEKIISGTFNEYAEDSYNHIVLDKIYKLDVSTPTASINDGMDGSYRYTLLKPTFNNNEAEYVEEANLDYNKQGSIEGAFTKGGAIVSYVWGYSNAYPVVKAENMDKAALDAKIAASLPQGYSTLESLLQAVPTLPDANWATFNANLRSNLPKGCMVTTYTYSPLVGLTSSTDPNGNATYYGYDSFGRLERVKDDKGNILKEYNYHYKE